MAVISDITNFSLSVKRFIQRQRYKKLDKHTGERRRLRVIKLGGYNGRRVWKIKSVSKLKLKHTVAAGKVSAKPWLSKLRDSYVNMMFNLAQSRTKQNPKKMGAENLHNKMIVEMYKSLGVKVEVLPDSVATIAHNQSNMRIIMI
ncbi:hypothetical protein SUGI_0114180 [Cryptomeria japonica]|nr:hypothetical protein SUGI_0114180 [Cryptomeria japonica]